MKIRISGSNDLVETWLKIIEKKSGTKGKLYKKRNSNQYNGYIDIDDRQAEALAKIAKEVNK